MSSASERKPILYRGQKETGGSGSVAGISSPISDIVGSKTTGARFYGAFIIANTRGLGFSAEFLVIYFSFLNS